MVTTPHGIRLRLVIGVALVAAAVSWIGLRLWQRADHQLPGVSWAALPILLAVALALYLAGRPVRGLVLGTATRPVSPLYAARILALSQAAAVTGAVVFGWYAAQVVLLVPDADIGSQQESILQVAVLAIGAALVAVSGLVVQRMCRLDDDDRDRRRDRERREERQRDDQHRDDSRRDEHHRDDHQHGDHHEGPRGRRLD